MSQSKYILELSPGSYLGKFRNSTGEPFVDEKEEAEVFFGLKDVVNKLKYFKVWHKRAKRIKVA